MKKYLSHGFTVVEILIVVAVIAILAAITLTVYGNVTDRANNDQTIAAVATYAKVLKTYSLDNNGYPIDTSFPCLGDTTTNCGVTPASPGCNSIGYGTGDATLKTAILSEINSLPALSKQMIPCNGASSVTGGLYYAATSTTAYLYYFLKGNVNCGSPAGIAPSYSLLIGSATECVLTLTQ